MPTATYDLIASNVLTTTPTSVSFVSIPNTYRDLVIVIDAKTTVNAQLRIRPNEDATSLVSVTGEGNGSTAQSNHYSNIGEAGSYNYLGTDSSIQIVQFLDYAQTDKHKNILLRANRASGGTGFHFGRWANTDAISSILILTDSGTFSSGSTFYLYGIVS